MRSREKGDSLFTMIPLERWNVEREDHFTAVRVGRIGASLFSTISYSPRGTEVKTTFHRPLERSVGRCGDLVARGNAGCVQLSRVCSAAGRVHLGVLVAR